MIDINLIRNEKEMVKENIKRKFKEERLPIVDKVYELDIEFRNAKAKADELRNEKNKLSDQIGNLMREGKKEEALSIKENVASISKEISSLEEIENKLEPQIRELMYKIPNIVADDVPLGEDDSKNVEAQRFGEAKVPSYEIPFHADIMASFNGIDKEAAARVSGNGFYYLTGDIARLHMIRSDAVDGVMSFEEKENMMYKIEGEDLYLIGTSEHSMIARYKDQILKEENLPITMTSYSPCFRKEVGAHGIEERGIYRIHQFEKQEMVVICKPEDSEEWYNKMWNYSVELFRSLDIPVRQLICCTGDLADLKYRSCDIEAWSPRQQKYFEVCSCSNLTSAQARRLNIKYKKEDGTKEFAHTLNNTVVAPPRMLIALLENNYQEDGSVLIPKPLRPYMGGKEKIIPNK